MRTRKRAIGYKERRQIGVFGNIREIAWSEMKNPTKHRLEDVELSKDEAKARQGIHGNQPLEAIEMPLTKSACGCPPPQIREAGEDAKVETTRYA
ncbi:hypothetical protein FDENT_12333 [Fusarium denticulatum]|uniref:Uncharacterized protein n=1 Tax=Fusarium denticulatum TaxID=48507 RepID=A0A8H5TCD7_9HYPO|nr:hypothetical protein FDENT_12333 [Fusarium denticulatum]